MPAPKGPKRTREEIVLIAALGYDYTAHEISERFNKHFEADKVTENQARYLRRAYCKVEFDRQGVGAGEYEQDKVGLNREILAVLA